jgi:hypothetical protein
MREQMLSYVQSDQMDRKIEKISHIMEPEKFVQKVVGNPSFLFEKVLKESPKTNFEIVLKESPVSPKKTTDREVES